MKPILCLFLFFTVVNINGQSDKLRITRCDLLPEIVGDYVKGNSVLGCSCYENKEANLTLRRASFSASNWYIYQGSGICGQGSLFALPFIGSDCDPLKASGFTCPIDGLVDLNKFFEVDGGMTVKNDAIVEGFTKLGSDAPSIKIKKLTGTTSGTEGSSVKFVHNLDASKIIDVSAMVKYSGNSAVALGYRFLPGYEFNMAWTSDVVTILNVPGNSSFILSKPVIITIMYEE